ncbi:MAG TPA: hypothetical protein VHO03_18310 [Ignavibacteriales bacterium]|nr:hypothetical protein [Ignavibacteriales bacterium]
MKIFCLPLNKNLASILFAAAALSAALICSGCSENKPSSQKQTDSFHSPAQNSPAQNSSANSSVHTLPDFTCTGYIKAVSSGMSANYILIDTVEWFSGDDALKAYSEDKKKKIANLPDPPQGFYIRNPKIDSLKIKISANPDIIMQTLSYDDSGNFKFNEAIGLQKFLSIFSRNNYAQFRHKPFSFKIMNGEIITVKEKYIP